MNFLELEDRYKRLMDEGELILKGVEFRSSLRNSYLKNIELLEKEYKELEDYIIKFKKAKKVIQKITDTRNEGAKKYIKDVVESGLTTILEEKVYKLEITDNDRGDSQKITDINLISIETGKPRKVGTAVKQITSILFIVSLLEMADSSRVLVLDEYLSGASGETAKKLSDVLVALSNNNEFQIFIVNHVLEISENPEVERIYLVNKGGETGLKIDIEKTNREKKKRQGILNNNEKESLIY